MGYLYETHLHTDEGSRCGKTPAKEYIPYYIDQGYRGIIVTDHFYGNVSYTPDRSSSWRDQMDFYCRGYEEALNEGIKRGLDVFFGVEQNYDGDEYLIYGVDKRWLVDHPDMVAWSRKMLFDEVVSAGGCMVQAHPFRVRDYISRIVLCRCVHAVEVFNAGNRHQDDLYALAYARRYNLPMTAGSDMHRIGERSGSLLYGVEFDRPWTDIGDYVKAILEHKTFGLRFDEGRNAGELMPLERPWEYRDENDEPAQWSPEEIR